MGGVDMNVKRFLAVLFSVFFFTAGCSAVQMKMDDSEWVLERLSGSEQKTGAAPSLTFSDEGKVAGFSGCNRFGGRYSQSGETLTFSKLFSTRKACAKDRMLLEREFLAALEQVKTLKNIEGKLILSGESGELLVFSRK